MPYKTRSSITRAWRYRKLELEDVGKLTTNGATFNSIALWVTVQRKFAFSSSSGYVSIEIQMQCTTFCKTQRTLKMGTYACHNWVGWDGVLLRMKTFICKNLIDINHYHKRSGRTVMSECPVAEVQFESAKGYYVGNDLIGRLVYCEQTLID